ncbi:MAG: helix-turn-helix transcriptional regulator [Azoarcus sp.]|nr:helix-turn-helix transcriptional regulator [Azoarcus sp.]
MEEKIASVVSAEGASAWLAHIADMLGAEASGMLTLHPDGTQSLIANGHADSAIAAYRDHFCRLDPLAGLLATRPAGRALILDTTTHPAYVAQRELSEDYLHPHGIDHVAAAQWRQPDGTLHLIGVQRFRGAAPFTVDQARELDSLIHHWRIGNALPHPAGFEDAHTTSRRNCDIAAQLHMPLVVVDAHLSIVWCNLAALEENGDIWTGLRKRGAKSKSEEALLRRLRELVTASLRTRTDTEALIETTGGAWFALVSPLVGKPGLSLLRLTAMNGLARGIRGRLQRVYGLTVAEAELAVLLANGDSLERIAELRAVTVETVRTQLKTVFRKTGANRQGQLVGWVVKLGRG